MKQLLLILSMILAIPSFAWDFKNGDLYYTITSLDKKTVEVAKDNGNYLNLSGSVTIPSTVSFNGIDFTVTRIGKEAFYMCGNVSDVKCPNTLKEIGEWAFRDSGLSSISLNEGLVTIENQAFENVKLSSIIIPNSVTTFTGAVFYGCKQLTDISLSSNLTSISQSCFSSCRKLSQITIPGSVTSIEYYAFENCTALTEIIIPNGVTDVNGSAFSGCTSLSQVSFGEKVSSIGNKVFENCTNLKNIICFSTIPPTCETSFINNGIYLTATLYVPEDCVNTYKSTSPWSSFSDIKEYDEQALNVSSVSVNYNETYGSVFFDGSIASSFDIQKGSTIRLQFEPNTGYELMSVVYNNIDVTDQVVNESYIDLSISAPQNSITVNFIKLLNGNFRNNGIYYEILSQNTVGVVSGYKPYVGAVNIPENIIFNESEFSVTHILDKGFYEATNLSAVTLPESLLSIGENAFSKCTALTKLRIPNNVTEIMCFAFSECTELSTIEMSNSLENLGGYAFSDCYALKSIDLPESLTEIGGNVFYMCTSLEELTIPKNITDLWWSGGCVTGCDNLKVIKLMGQVTRVSTDLFLGKNLRKVYVYSKEPPYTNNQFNTSGLADIILYVPEESIPKYKQDDYWSKYGIITSIPNLSGIEVIPSDTEGSSIISYTNLNGITDTTPFDGINIILYSNGNTKIIYLKK